MPDHALLEEMIEAPPEGAVAPQAPRREARRPAAPARRQVARPPRAIQVYQRGRAAVGLTIIALLFALAWLLNGFFTARAVVGLGGDWTLGAGIHLAITAVELTTVFAGTALRDVRAPWVVSLLIWLIVLLVGTADTLSSAVGFAQWGLALGLPLGLSLHVGATVLAELIAFLPEPMLVWIGAALWRILAR